MSGLVLSRKIDQRILIGDNIWITVVRVDREGANTTVKLHIDAPRDLKIWREELLDDVSRNGSNR